MTWLRRNLPILLAVGALLVSTLGFVWNARGIVANVERLSLEVSGVTSALDEHVRSPGHVAGLIEAARLLEQVKGLREDLNRIWPAPSRTGGSQPQGGNP